MHSLGFLLFVTLTQLGFATGRGIVIPWADLYRPSYKPTVVISTWPLLEPARSAFKVLQNGGSPVEAVVAGCTVAEADPNVTTVGYGGSPDEIGNTTLDAMVMDGDTMNVGAVAGMPYIKQAAQVALGVLNSTRHTLLVGEASTKFAESLGYHRTNLSTNESLAMWKQWKNASCQPNYRMPFAWTPDPNRRCGPYHYKNSSTPRGFRPELGIDERNHDTIGVIALDQRGRLAVGLSTNGARFRIPGRVGDSPIAGAGGYADSKVGAAAGTGDGDVMMRFLLSFKAVELMRAGKRPSDACTISLKSVRQNGTWYGGLIALNANGQYGAACVGFKSFAFVVQDSNSAKNGKVINVKCLT
nr:N(4) (Beta N acetylglucosaminyl) L asparaginase [Hymenolepis microstoma]